MRRFIDIGANLTDPQFRGIYRGSVKHANDFDAVIGRAKDSHVEKMLVTGSSLEESQEALELCRQFPNYLYSTVGVHPCSSTTVPEDPEKATTYINALSDLARRGAQEGHIKAFGEIGLDYDRLHYAPMDVQQRVFGMQLELASTLGLPLFLHSRAAGEDFNRMVKPYVHLGGVVHSFTGTVEELNGLLALGLYIGVNGCSLKTTENLDVVKEIPLNRLMLETDGPWCEIRRTHASHQHTRELPYEFAKKPEKWKPGQMVRGRCEPCSIANVAQVVAFVKDVSEQEVIDAAYENTINVFFKS